MLTKSSCYRYSSVRAGLRRVGESTNAFPSPSRFFGDSKWNDVSCRQRMTPTHAFSCHQLILQKARVMGAIFAFISFWILSIAFALVSDKYTWIMAQQPQTSHSNDQGQEWTHPRVPRRRREGSRWQHHQHGNDAWKEPLIQVEYIPPDSINSLFQPSMLLLAGLPGSGKSTFARCLVHAMPYKVTHIHEFIFRPFFTLSNLNLVRLARMPSYSLHE